ncbi:MAG: GxxExxY protein [Minisyncoccota bacterium]
MKLSDTLSSVFRILPAQEKALKKLGISNIEDLLYHFPVRYGNTADVVGVGDLKKGDTAVVFGQISGLKTKKGFRSHIPMSEAWVKDESGRIKIVWFHQAYLAKMLVENSFVRVEGKVSQKKSGELYFSNPKIEEGQTLLNPKSGEHTLYPVYPETRGLTSNWIFHKIQKIFTTEFLDSLVDPIPTEILKKYNLPSLRTALVWIHTPHKVSDAESARKRFAFEEIFFIQLDKQKTKHEFLEKNAFVIDKSSEEMDKFISRFPFEATDAQLKSIEHILSDFKRGHPMSRLLEGDVGSGKTAVAAAAAYAVTMSRPKGQTFGTLQTAYMVPTEILAQQHFESFIKYFKHLPINIALITGTGCRKFPSKVNPEGWTNISRSQLLKWVASGEIAILIGTHALIQKSVKFKHLAFAIIDEQHRFGVNQRQSLISRLSAEETPKNAEVKEEKVEVGLLYKDLTYIIRQVIFDVKKELGLGHKEVIYQKAIEEELKQRKISFSREKQIPIFYNKKKIGVYVPDFVIEDKVILELKAVPFIGASEKKQLWNYLKGSDYRLALLTNFGPRELEIQRVIYDSARISASSQRSSASTPHLLSMTATPIPRTLALTLYGDLDLSLLDEMPAGRKKIITEIVTSNGRPAAYKKIRDELASGRQLYVICPRINEPDPTKEMSVLAKSVSEEAKRLKKEIFPKYNIGILHSKMKPAEKDSVMFDFRDKKIDVLVATSVVEVGVNVENASLIIIEGAERFGLAQLHQLRGRVLRGTHQPYCFVFAETKSDKTIERLKALQTAKNGFELAEFDLKQRGAGELYGRKQWGLSDLAMEAIKNIKMVEVARTEATRIIEEDPTLSKYPDLKIRINSAEDKIHFE